MTSRDVAPADLAQIEAADPGIDTSEAPRSAPYPMWPDLPSGAIANVYVYRKNWRQAESVEWIPIALPWSAATITWELVADICGGGSYAILGKKSGHIVRSAQRTIEGPPKSPTTKDVYKLTPSLTVNGSGEIIETPIGGWVSIPGLDPGTSAAFVAFQQVAWKATEDANKAIAALFTLTNALAGEITKPDPGLAVLENIAQVQRETIDKLYRELNSIRTELHTEKVRAASEGSATREMKLKLYQKGIDIIDGAAGAIAMKLSGTTTGDATSLGATVANTIMERAKVAAGQQAAAQLNAGAPAGAAGGA